MRYIYQLPKWPQFNWDERNVSIWLAETRHRQGLLVGRLEGFGFKQKNEAALLTFTQDILKSSEIEGERLNEDLVRSSVARQLGIEIAGLSHRDRYVDGVVEMMLDATQNFAEPLTGERLFAWHSALFPTGRSGLHKITVGDWRLDQQGPMRVISGSAGREKIHYEAPPARIVKREMSDFFKWFNRGEKLDPVLKAAIAHFRFVTIHPFDDGNGRIARAIGDLQLARSEQSAKRFYSLSAQIQAERKKYYDILERTQKGELDLTDWIEWFLHCLRAALEKSEATIGAVARTTNFWEKHAKIALNDRQRKMVLKMLEGFTGKLTTTKWAKLMKCSPDTALRDIEDLIAKKILRKDPGGGRSTSYSLVGE